MAIHNHMVTNNPRMTVSHNGVNTWKLHIRDVQRNDSGHYMCQINTEPMVSQIGMLEVSKYRAGRAQNCVTKLYVM